MMVLSAESSSLGRVENEKEAFQKYPFDALKSTVCTAFLDSKKPSIVGSTSDAPGENSTLSH
jgi:hypothetical protein